MALLAWIDSFSVGVETLDGQHATLLKMVNELHAAIVNPQARSAPGELLNELARFARGHFSFEEEMMAATNYPGRPRHCMLHRDLTKLLEELIARYHRWGNVNIHLLRFIAGRLARHIEIEDREYGPWLNRHGVR